MIKLSPYALIQPSRCLSPVAVAIPQTPVFGEGLSSVKHTKTLALRVLTPLKRCERRYRRNHPVSWFAIWNAPWLPAICFVGRRALYHLGKILLLARPGATQISGRWATVITSRRVCTDKVPPAVFRPAFPARTGLGTRWILNLGGIGLRITATLFL